jgi:hypothetical protein
LNQPVSQEINDSSVPMGELEMKPMDQLSDSTEINNTTKDIDGESSNHNG